MREQIDTIPVNDAFLSGDECPFCFMERQAEQSAIRFTLGPSASYMEPEVRGITNRTGFCGIHLKKMYDYGNSLGSALILQTHLESILDGLEDQLDNYTLPEKKPLFSLKKQTPAQEDPLVAYIRSRTGSCFICDKIDYNLTRYYHTFFYLLREPEFRRRVEDSKGFCLRHFARLMELAPDKLPDRQRDWFYATVLPLMRRNLQRVKEDIDWFVAKYDYRNAGAPWKNSRDAVSRTIEKLQGLHPADPPYKQDG